MSTARYDYLYGKYDKECIDSRWAEEHEIKSVLTCVDFAQDELSASGVPLISDGRKVYVDASDTHTLVLGSSGSKKSRNMAFPQVMLNIKARHSMVVLDVKGEIYDRTSGMAQKAGYDVYVLNLRDPARSHRWNPFREPWRLLHEEKNIDRCNEMLNDIITILFFPDHQRGNLDPFWENMAARLALGLADVLLTCADADEAHFKSLMYLRYSGIDMDARGVLVDMTEDMPKDSYAYSNLGAVFTAPDRTRASIVASFDADMRIFSAQPGITELFSGSDFDIRQLGEKPTIIYIIAPDEKNTFAQLVTIFVQESYQILIGHASAQPDRRLKVTTEYILDEFAQLPYIAGFTEAISAARSRNIRFTLFVQSLHQLKSTYGEKAETIIANAGNTIFTTSRELPLLQRMADLCGYSRDGIYLISPSRLQRLRIKDKGEALILVGACYPYITNLTDIDDYDYEHIEPMPLPVVEKKAPMFELKKAMRRAEWIGNYELMFEQQGREEEQKAKKKHERDDSWDSFDLQRELERKFDELFGSLDDDDE